MSISAPSLGQSRRTEYGRMRQRGFTLIEVVIALVLISLLMLLLTAAMRSMGQTESAIEERIEQVDDYRTAVNFLRDVLGEVSARSLASSTQADVPPVFFVGRPQELAWIGVLPARYGMGGRHYMRLALEEGNLVLRFVPWNGAATHSDWASAQARVLVTGVMALKLSFQDGRDGQWLDAWPPEKVPRSFAEPSAVQIELESAALSWPPLAIAVSGMLGGDPSANSEMTAGGGSRR